MQELIGRLRALLDEMPAGPATPQDLILIRGCHDLLLAMEERAATIREIEVPLEQNLFGAEQLRLIALWERA